jgi:hypothetical protein
MESEKRNKSLLTPLLRWLTGDANRRDEQSLDAAAKSDPFLADALEGYRSLPEADHAADVTRLKAGLRKQTQRQQGAGFYLLRAAAALAVVVVAWLVVQQFATTGKSPVADVAVAPNEAETSAAPTTAASADSTTRDIAAEPSAPEQDESSSYAFQDEPKLSRNEQAAPPAARVEAPGAASQASPKPEQATKVADNALADADDALNQAKKEEIQRKLEADEKVRLEAEVKAKQDATTAKANTEAAKKAKDTAVPAAPAKEEMAKASKKQSNMANPRQITGQVTDGNGSPLIGASVMASGTNAGTVTNVDGTYSLTLPAGATALEFNFTGYNPLRVTLGANNKVDVELTENEASLSEVVVTGAGQVADEQPAYESLQPVGGFKQFKQYVANNLRHPEADKQPRPKQVVRVRFTLQADGRLTDFNPKGDAPQAYKDEAIRLLREGPRWEGTTGTTASYRFVFE